MKKICCLALVLVCSLFGDEVPKIEKKEPPKEEISVTNHEILINGHKIPYKATAGTLFFKDEKGDAKAEFFYIAYTKEGEDKTKRPITYCFNGGPGSSAIWLHLGVLGPKRVEIDHENFTPPPYKVIDNPYSFLDITDLVFIDPISTGYSRPVAGEDAKQFHGVEEDIKSVAEFIRLYTTRNNRWDSPKFLLGESYGTTRAAGLAAYLHDENRMFLNGVILVSAALNFQTLDDDPGNDLCYIVFLPSYTAAAWYHKKLDPELQKQDLKKTLREVEDFAIGEYATALLQGDKLDPKQRAAIIDKLSRYTGLSKQFIDLANLRVCQARFSKELLRLQRRSVGRFDSRFLGIENEACSNATSYDPSAEAVFGVYTAAFNAYVREDLKWDRDAEYKVLANVWPWNYGKAASNKYLDVTDNLRNAMTRNPALRVYVGSGIYDLATPYFGTDYTFDHLGLDPSLRKNVQKGYYEAGHMMYIHFPSLERFKDEVGDFIINTLKK